MMELWQQRPADYTTGLVSPGGKMHVRRIFLNDIRHFCADLIHTPTDSDEPQSSPVHSCSQISNGFYSVLNYTCKGAAGRWMEEAKYNSTPSTSYLNSNRGRCSAVRLYR